jgi:hypothetical protein
LLSLLLLKAISNLIRLILTILEAHTIMLFTNHRANHFSPLRVSALLALMIIVLCGAANTINGQTNRSTYLDFTGDGKTDWAVYTPPQTFDQSFRLKILGNQTGSAPSQPLIRIFEFGLSSDILFFGDYIGDRKTDLVAWRRGQPNVFYVAQFPIGTADWTLERAVRWGTQTDGAVQGDYDGDGKMDYTAVRSSNNVITWFILSSSTNAMRTVNFGNAALGHFTISGADFTGDGRDELIVASNVNGTMTYYIGDAVTGAWLFTRQWGFSNSGGFSNSDIDHSLPPADYTGDGKADFVAVRRTGSNLVWYILDPATNTSTATLWGIGMEREPQTPDIPVRGDYDGDGRQDIAVYRRSNQTFYVLKSSDGSLIVQLFGAPGDRPLNVPIFAVIA